MALLKDSVCYFEDLPVANLMELALSLVPRTYLKHEIIAKENVPSEGIYFVYSGSVDILLTSVSATDYSADKTKTCEFNYLLETLGPRSSFCSWVHCRPKNFWRHNTKIISRGCTTIFLLPKKILSCLRHKITMLDMGMTEVGKYQTMNGAPKCDFVKWRTDTFHRNHVTMVSRKFHDAVRRVITLNRHKKESDLNMLSMLRNVREIGIDFKFHLHG
jgi:hypothetical protein